MEVLSSRILLHPRDFDRSRQFWAEVMGLHIYREFAGGHGIVFFLGGGFLELSGSVSAAASPNTELWLQVRSLDDTHQHLAAASVTIDEPPTAKPWGLREMRIRDPDDLTVILVEVPDDHPLRRDRR